MAKPLIGITANNGENRYGRPAVVLLRTYTDAVIRAGGAPVIIPSALPEDGWRTLYAHLDGILFSGGGDIVPERFNGASHPRVDNLDPERDDLEIPLLQTAVQDGKPFLGICRGIQVVNVALGGTLYTHIADQYPNALRHDYYPDYPRDKLAHPVRVEEGSHLAEILGEPILQVNSLHHQGLKDIPAMLKVTAYAPDGLVEGLELPDHPFGIAVQWHPEWLQAHAPMRALFRSFVEAAGA